MIETRIERKLASLMCVIFATHLVMFLYGMYAGAIMYKIGPKVFNIGNVILDLPIISCTFIIASNKNLFVTPAARIASWIFFGLQTFSLFNTLCYIVFDNNIPGLIGSTANLFFPIIFACSIIWFYASLRMWLPLKIVSIISALPPIASGILLYQVVDKDFSDDLMPIYDAIGTTVMINAALYAIALILSIIWAARKPLAPHAQSNPIDII